MSTATQQDSSPILASQPLGFPWQTLDPFLATMHHDDRYPAGNAELGPAAPLTGRALGEDFAGKDGWRMYHGEVVPGFPAHPHRGFETVTIVRRGLVDHADSAGAAARYGQGDVQWLTAGKGIQHSEMFPLLDPAGPNPLELFQIWVNLARADKFAEPHFAMLWGESIPRVVARDEAGRTTEIAVVAGSLGEARALPPPPHSWAARADSDFAIWTLKLAPGARWTLPPARPGTNRVLYFFRGESMRIASEPVRGPRAVQLRPDAAVELEGGPGEVELVLLQGRPIGEPVVQHGPFVMGSREEIQQTFADYQRTRFGGWRWPSDAPVHPRGEGRFARRPDGSVERPPKAGK